MQATQKFNSNRISEYTGKPVKFSTYAYFLVYKNVSDAFKECNEFVRTPRNNNGKYNFKIYSYEQIVDGDKDLNGKNRLYNLELELNEKNHKN